MFLLMKKRWIVVAALLVLALVAVGASLWFSREERPTVGLVTNLVESGGVAVRVDRFEMAWEQPAGVRKMPPPWVMRSPALLRGWVALFMETEHVYDGLVWYLVDARVTSDQPLTSEEIDFRLDYGAYTLGTRGRSFRDDGGPYEISTRFEVTDGPLPTALEIQVKGEWLRFPVDVRRGRSR